MNIVVLKGNLTRDPESRTVKTGDRETTVVNFSIAVNRHYKTSDGSKGKEVTFVDCEAWDSGGENIAKFVGKGDPILVNGALKLDQWETDGQKRTKLKVRVSGFELLHRAPKETSPQEEERNDDPAAVGDDDIPF